MINEEYTVKAEEDRMIEEEEDGTQQQSKQQALTVVVPPQKFIYPNYVFYLGKVKYFN